MGHWILNHKDVIDLILVTVPSFLLTAVSLFFFYQQTGYKLLISHGIQIDRTTADRISPLTIINMKNRPVAIHAIFVVLNKKEYLKIADFKKPFILQGLEATTIETEPVSVYLKDGNIYKPDFLNKKKQFLVSVGKKLVKCNTVGHALDLWYYLFKKYQHISADKDTYNGVVFSPNVKYAVVYNKDNETKTFFIDRGGLIKSDDSLPFNMLPTEIMGSRKTVQEVIRKCIPTAIVDDLQEKFKRSGNS